MNLTRRFTPHTVYVRDATAGGGMGGGYASERTVENVWIVDEQKVVKSKDGTEVVSNTQVSTNLDEFFPIGSLVTVWKGLPNERTATVVAVSTFRHQRLQSHHTHFLN